MRSYMKLPAGRGVFVTSTASTALLVLFIFVYLSLNFNLRERSSIMSNATAYPIGMSLKTMLEKGNWTDRILGIARILGVT